jgi:tRNA(Ile)-lysidine synthetase-like protein
VATGTVERVRTAVERALAALEVPPDVRLLVAVSGGQDSVCLLDALSAVLTAASARLIAVHVDHRLREEASAADAAAAAALAGRLGLPSITVQADLANYARQERLGLEEAGRYLRYQALAALSQREMAWGAATGHTLDDLAETMLINLIRGTGPAGLPSIPAVQSYRRAGLGPPFPELEMSGLREATELRVIRPLLSIGRRETAEYCAQAGLEYRVDCSNLDPLFLRNRVRHHLLPLLRTYNPSIVPTLGRLARLAADDEQELERAVDAAWSRAATVGPAEVAFSWDSWAGLSAAIQRRLLRRARRQLGGGEHRSFQSLESARALLGGRAPARRLSLGGGVHLLTSRVGFRLVAAGPVSGATAKIRTESRGCTRTSRRS